MVPGGLSMTTLLGFGLFGLLVGVVFGYFGMGSFMVTPTLLVLGYDPTVAVGSGLAFVFGTAVIATLKHREMGQVDYALGLVTIVGTTVGIEVGKRGLLALRSIGLADGVVGGAYVLLLGGVGAMVVREALGDGSSDDDGETSGRPSWVPRLGVRPCVSLRDGGRISAWTLVPITFLTGLPAGLLGIGGGFIRVPALTYLVGVTMPIAVGTSVFAIAVSGGIGSLSWAQAGGVELGVVAPLLLGSAFGARLGSAITGLVEAETGRLYFGVMLLLGAVAVSVRQVGIRLGVPELRVLGVVLIVGSAAAVAATVLYSGVRALRSKPKPHAAGD
ncbi:sulfite exporter TauE/SafE family protein [Halanaeroarchaeum sulfurireducens]|nr:sulfite exporter TauE/SafE family protein [Halanaeroarchaeum sulfurireducens]